MLRQILLVPRSVCLISILAVVLPDLARGQETPPAEPATANADPAPPAPETPPAATPAPATPAPATPAPATPAPAPATPAAPETPAPAAPETPAPSAPVESQSDAGAVFAAKLVEWKALLKDLRALKTEFDEADEDALVPILKRWKEMIARGDAMIGELRELGGKAYAAAPEEDRELTRFLIKIMEDDMARDAYEPAAQVSQALLDHGCDVAAVFSAGGIAAFCTNDFDRADKYFKEAENRGGMSGEAPKYAGMLSEYRSYWEVEQKIREAEAAANDLPRVKMTTTQGELMIELFENEAPGAVGNFISLVEKGFYDGLLFHRVLEHFMAQGGCPQGTGGGGPGYNIYCETKNENHRKHFRGTLSMAHAGPDTGGSQFFITFVPTAHLNGLHTAFGRVIDGFEVLSKLQRIDPSAKDKKQADGIVKIEVLRKRDHEYVPNKVE